MRATTPPPPAVKNLDSRPHVDSFPLLDICPEMRNLLYATEIATNPSSSTLHLTHHLGLISLSPLARLNSQIRAEYLSLAAYDTQTIKTFVHNFDFDHILTFLHNTTTTIPPRRNMDSSSPRKTLVIELRFSSSSSSLPSASSILAPGATPRQHARWTARLRRWRDAMGANSTSALHGFEIRYEARNFLPFGLLGLRTFELGGWRGGAAVQAERLGRALDEALGRGGMGDCAGGDLGVLWVLEGGL